MTPNCMYKMTKEVEFIATCILQLTFKVFFFKKKIMIAMKHILHLYFIYYLKIYS